MILGAIYLVWLLVAAFCLIVFIMSIVYCFQVRFGDPTLTETQLFLKCWGAYLASIVSGFFLMLNVIKYPWKKD